MAIEFKTITTNTNDLKVSTSFEKNVLSADVALKGFDLTYGNDDHGMKISRLEIQNVTFNGNEVSYEYDFCFCDDWNHNMGGNVTALIIAVTE
jgi:hypothetical protein